MTRRRLQRCHHSRSHHRRRHRHRRRHLRPTTYHSLTTYHSPCPPRCMAWHGVASHRIAPYRQFRARTVDKSYLGVVERVPQILHYGIAVRRPGDGNPGEADSGRNDQWLRKTDYKGRKVRSVGRSVGRLVGWCHREQDERAPAPPPTRLSNSATPSLHLTAHLHPHLHLIPTLTLTLPGDQSGGTMP